MDTHYTVTLKKTDSISNELILTTVDSEAETGETVVKVPLSNGQPQIGGKMDEWCLGNKYCYYLTM